MAVKTQIVDNVPFENLIHLHPKVFFFKKWQNYSKHQLPYRFPWMCRTCSDLRILRAGQKGKLMTHEVDKDARVTSKYKKSGEATGHNPFWLAATLQRVKCKWRLQSSSGRRGEAIITGQGTCPPSVKPRLQGRQSTKTGIVFFSLRSCVKCTVGMWQAWRHNDVVNGLHI